MGSIVIVGLGLRPEGTLVNSPAPEGGDAVIHGVEARKTGKKRGAPSALGEQSVVYPVLTDEVINSRSFGPQ